MAQITSLFAIQTPTQSLREKLRDAFKGYKILVKHELSDIMLDDK